MGRWFRRTILSRRWAAFIVMGLAFFVFGCGTVNLAMLLHANVRLLAEHGWLAVMEGGLLQLVELVATGYLSMAAYLLFRTCEEALLRSTRGG